MKLFITNLSSLFILLILSGCQTIETRGQFIDNNLLTDLEARRLNKEQVENLLGSPTLTPSYAPDNWYYVERTMSQRAWFRPNVLQQRIVKITFNHNMVEKVLVINNSHNEGLQITSEYTKTYGTELNPIQRFVKNIGRFNQTTKEKKKK